GPAALAALGPDFAAVRQQWESTAGVKLEEIDQLIVSIHDNDSQMPRFAATVRLKAPADMPARWGNPPAAGGASRYSVKGQTAWVPPDGQGRVFVIGAAEPVGAVASLAAPQAKPVVGQYFSHLLEMSDDKQHVVALFDPQFFHTDGRDMFQGPYKRLVDPLEWFFGDEAQGMASFYFGGDFYAELRMFGRLQKTPSQLQTEMQTRLDQLPQRVTDYADQIQPSGHWSRLWRAIPFMVRYARGQVRMGAEDDALVVNLAMPGMGAHNLLAATDYSLRYGPGTTYAGPATGTGGGPTPPTAAGPKDINELLASKVDLGFDQQSLEFAMKDLVAATKEAYPSITFPFDIRIIGGDLQKEGITRNQQIRDVRAAGVPVADILTQLVRKANPVTTVKEPSEIDQKLVWLVAPDPDDPASKIVLVTTRAAATEKKLALPAIFQPKP
ncbi:MAG: hypothetical protein KDA41_00125, partial [Planctomycetales bacterium]|nr:hypothetical protein [Planctomycetales bacterium]